MRSGEVGGGRRAEGWDGGTPGWAASASSSFVRSSSRLVGGTLPDQANTLLQPQLQLLYPPLTRLLTWQERAEAAPLRRTVARPMIPISIPSTPHFKLRPRLAIEVNGASLNTLHDDELEKVLASTSLLGDDTCAAETARCTSVEFLRERTPDRPTRALGRDHVVIGAPNDCL